MIETLITGIGRADKGATITISRYCADPAFVVKLIHRVVPSNSHIFQMQIYNNYEKSIFILFSTKVHAIFNLNFF